MSILTNRAATERTFGLLKHSLNLIRTFSASPIPTATPVAAEPGSTPSKKPKRNKKKNLFEVVQYLPNWGIGYQLAKSHWVGLSYQITKINLYKDGRHGKAWGIVYKDGSAAADAPRKISGVHKRCWRYLPTKRAIESSPKVEAHAA